MEKTCIICGRKYKKPYTLSKNGWEKRKTCSRECFHKRHKILMKGRPVAQTKEALEKRKKTLKEKYTKGILVIWNKGKKNIEMKKRWEDQKFREKMIKYGKENRSWKGDNIKFQYRHRTIYYRKTHKICEECGILKKRMHVHHKDGNIKNNEPENLILLCPKCHNTKHLKNKKRDIFGRFLSITT